MTNSMDLNDEENEDDKFNEIIEKIGTQHRNLS